ncbi:probable nucleoredoxin 1 [Chenopodium quinoa]|nr:probable nucleoredoxin 1 [Chenopodium quinoa]XP_021735279.1 probable nucleoredoxin 1 [Chenopodium quinoa]
MVCCYHVPIFREESISLYVQGLVTTCFDLYSSRQDFELVVVAKMNKMVNYEAVFNHFLSGFPASCLVVPFSDSKRRDFICKYLDLDHGCNCLILDDNGSVLLHEHPSFVRSYGADGFPFTQEHRHKLRLKDLALLKSLSTSNLELLLQCKPSDVVDRINSAGVREVKTISELSTKLVGLYLCAKGNFIPTLDEVYQQCITKHLEIEIVVVYMPFGDCLDPQAYKLNIDTKLKRKKIYWWRLSFDNSVSLGIKRLANASMDKLIIMGPRGEFVDLYGEEVMSYYGIDGYPFTRKGLVHRELKKLKEVTLESLLVHGSRDFVLQGDNRIPVAQLQGRYILIYLDCLYDFKYYENMLFWYYKMKELRFDFEVVFLRRVDDDDDISGIEVGFDDLVMPWLVCPFEFDHSASVNKKLFTQYESHDTLVQFGQNGQISAFPTLEDLPSFTFGTNDFPFTGFNLRDFVTCQFREDFMRF